MPNHLLVFFGTHISTSHCKCRVDCFLETKYTRVMVKLVLYFHDGPLFLAYHFLIGSNGCFNLAGPGDAEISRLEASSTASVCCNHQGRHSKCNDMSCKSDGVNLEQVFKARTQGVLELSPTDEVEGEIIYFQHRLLGNAFSRKRLAGLLSLPSLFFFMCLFLFLCFFHLLFLPPNSLSPRAPRGSFLPSKNKGQDRFNLKLLINFHMFQSKSKGVESCWVGTIKSWLVDLDRMHRINGISSWNVSESKSEAVKMFSSATELLYFFF